MKAIISEIGAFADAHPGMVQKQEDVGRQIIATKHLIRRGDIPRIPQRFGVAFDVPADSAILSAVVAVNQSGSRVSRQGLGLSLKSGDHISHPSPVLVHIGADRSAGAMPGHQSSSGLRTLECRARARLGTTFGVRLADGVREPSDI